ncbi:MAG TPA: hypothetical protein PK440_21175 [Candidatus Accumulibacter phosphatis]|nr:hypothetical protein [Accumulibacter sp.]HCN69090.1 hypothetical protein [Accumulibacter sp.]HRL78494.1 hypothetical protein [Candidatus Accumulibacter phosphatis]HRQ97471.1 hypothetical protein [Candidatus Accumulibacter phosphatis]
MAREIAESDWRLFRKLHAVALERFYARLLNEIEAASAAETGSHQRYLDICRIIERGNLELSVTFSDLRRSTALLRIVSLRDRALLTEDELSGFSQQVVEVVNSLVDGRPGQYPAPPGHGKRRR